MISKYNEFLEVAYRNLNMAYFNNTLPEAVITIQSSGRCYGYITIEKVWRDSYDAYREINMSAEYLDRPMENILATLLHEMCHLYAMENNIKDTSNGGRYHNKEFKRIAEKRDLKINYHKYIGWSVTEPAEGLIETMKKYRMEERFEYVRMSDRLITLGGNGDDGENGTGNPTGINGVEKKKTSTRKYICPACGNTFRATKDIRVLCMDCMKPFEKA